MKKVMAGLILSMVGMVFSTASIAAAGDTGTQTKGASGETGAAPMKGPSGETGTASKSGSGETGTAAKPIVKEYTGSSKAVADGSLSPKEAYKKAEDDYKAAKKKCDEMKDNEKEVCVAEARAARTKAKADVEVASKNTSSARRKAQVDIAKAEYGVAKAKCNAKEGEAKDKCINDAKEARAKATLETTTQEKASTAMESKKQAPNQERAGTRPENRTENK